MTTRESIMQAATELCDSIERAEKDAARLRALLQEALAFNADEGTRDIDDWEADVRAALGEAADPGRVAAISRPPDCWINVKDRLPPRHQDVLCWNHDGWIFHGRVCAGLHEPFFTYPRGDGSPSNTAPSWILVTHWMPLPAPPLHRCGRTFATGEPHDYEDK